MLIVPTIVSLCKLSITLNRYLLQKLTCFLRIEGEPVSIDLEVRRVTLYRAGVGWFELDGEITGESTRIFFKEKDMNDLLKTLNVELIGETESRIRAISFDSALPPEKLKESLSITISPTDSIRNLIQELVGRRVEVGLISGTAIGTVIGEQTIQGVEKAEKVYLVLRDDNGTIKFLFLDEIQSLNLEDKDLNADLSRALEIENASKLKETKPLSIYFTSKDVKTFRLSYLAETPAWKTSYRVYYNSDEAKTILQGWAIVDNTQQQNWDNVYLTLVTGLPITFIYDLFSPQHIQRPYVDREEVTTLMPEEIEEEYAIKSKMEALEGIVADMPMGAPAAAPPMSRMKTKRAVARSDALEVTAKAKEIGDTYVVYEIPTPVTIKRNQSALVPLIQEPLEGRKIRIYNPRIHARHPLMAFELKNTTEKVIEKGPFTVVLDNVYAGEGILPMLRPEEERIVSFALEQAVTVVKDVQEEIHWFGVDFLKIYLKKRLEALREITYTITNKRDELVTVLVDEPKQYGYKPFGEVTSKETETYYRYEFPISPNTSEKFHLTFKKVYYEEIEKQNITEKEIKEYLRKEFITKEQAAQLYEIVKLRNCKRKLEQEKETLENALERTEKEQTRLRENLKALGDSVEEAKLRKRYVDKLSQQEERIEKWQQKVKILNEQIKKAVEDLESFFKLL